MENEIIRRAHDKCFKGFFKRKNVVADYIRYYIPYEIRRHVDLNSLHISMTGFISREMKEYFSDVLATLDIIGSANSLRLYFLYEHKSHPDWFARVQMLNYEIQKWIELKESNQLSSHLPVIIPVLIYNGKDKWKFSTDFEDYFELPSEHFLDFVPKFRHIHHDIGQMDDASFKTSTVMEIFHLLLKYIHYDELESKIDEIYSLIAKLPDGDEARDYLEISIRYILSIGKVPKKRLVHSVKNFAGGEKMYGVAAQEIINEAIAREKPYWEQQGEIKNAQQYIIENLTERFDVVGQSLSEKIKSIQSLDILNMLFKKTHRVNSVEEFDQLVDKVLN